MLTPDAIMYSFGQIMAGGLNTVSGPFHPFGGAVDIIVVRQEDGTFKSTPFYVRFGKFQGVLKRREKVVNVSVNGVGADFCMYLDHRGQVRGFIEEESTRYTLPPSLRHSLCNSARKGSTL